jgi:hypothetical protein
MNKTYILIDTVSIQKYVFASNKLSMNIGASYIVGHKLFNNKKFKNFTVIYSGGGNAMLEFATDDDANKFIESYSLDILLHYPGLKLAFGRQQGDIDALQDENFKKFMTDLHKDLRKCKFENFSQVTPFQSGIVSVCRYTGESASFFDTSGNEKRYISYSAKSRSNKAVKATELLQNGLSAEYKAKFDFPTKLEELGQQEGKGYIAIVHIDGNGVGDMFMSCANKTELQDLSKSVNRIVNNVYAKLLVEICNLKYDDLGLELKKEKETEEKGKLFLPFRPILLGGDDITFVCEGTLGIYLANRFLELYEMETINFQNEVKELKACAGIAIVKTKFPFFKGYDMAEKLLSEAKNSVRGKPGEIYPSALSYKIQSTGNSDEYKSSVLRFDELQKQIDIITYFNDGNNGWSQNKIMQLRDALDIKIKAGSGDCHEYEYFIAHAGMRGLTLPPHNSLYELFNAIEMMEFYPIGLIKNKTNEKAN